MFEFMFDIEFTLEPFDMLDMFEPPYEFVEPPIEFEFIEFEL